MNRKFKIIILCITILSVALSGCSKAKKSNAIEEEKYIPVEVEEAIIKPIENNVKLNGKIVANEEVAIIPKASGIVTNINVELGDYVKEGSLLFTIEQEDLLRNVEQGQSAIEIASRGVEQAKNALDSARLNYELNKDKLENAKINLERTRKLYEEGLVSKAQLEQAELAADEKNLEILKNQIEQAETAYEQALNQLRQAEISGEQFRSNLENTLVKAPMDGVISQLNVKEGQIIGNGQLAATIVDMDKVYIELNIVDDMINKISIGQEVDVSVPAAFEGYIKSHISYISPTADSLTQLYPIKIYMENQDRKIKPGMNGEVSLHIDKIEASIVIDGNAVLDNKDNKIVFIVKDDKAIEKIVTTGLDTGDYIEIKSGIDEGDLVIVKGQHYVKDGEKVKLVRGE